MCVSSTPMGLFSLGQEPITDSMKAVNLYKHLSFTSLWLVLKAYKSIIINNC